MNVKAEELKKRTAAFAEAVVRFVRDLPDKPEARKIGVQLLAAGTSVAANYRAACRARSRAEFVAKLGLVVEEVDESDFWLDLLVKTEIVPEQRVEPLRTEAGELTAIFVASQKTANGTRRRAHR